MDNKESYIEYENNNQIKEYAKLNVNVVIEEKELKEEVAEKSISKAKSIVKLKEDESFLRKTEYDSLLNLAVNFQLKADSIRWIIDDSRLIFDKTKDGQERAKLGNKIIELEREIYSLQKQADGCYEKVREIEQINLATKKVSYESNKEETIIDDVIEIPEKEKPVNVIIEPEDNEFNKSKLEPVIVEENNNVKNNNYGLKVKIPSSYNSKNPIKINERLPEGIIYMIQLGAYSSIKNSEVFKGLEPLICIKKSNSNIHKYFAGRFLQLTDAEKNLNTVRSKGFSDAYIVAFNSGKIIPVKTAVNMESKVIDKSSFIEKKKETEISKKDLGIIYAIQGELPINDSNKIEGIRSLLDEDLDLFIEKNSSVVNFIINSFDTFEIAFKLKSQIEAIVQKEVEIHAYFAENQIPLDQARKITE